DRNVTGVQTCALPISSRNAQAVVERQEYRVRLNPRKVFSRARVPIHLDSYRLWIGVFDRASRHTTSITRTLQHVTEGYARKIGQIGRASCREGEEIAV